MNMLKNAEPAQLIGSSAQMLELKQEIERIARTDAKVLITGESGVGKELVARAIHTHSLRADKPFIAMNCAGLPETLLESELFGHVKGSFTGAYRDKPGKLEAAHEGTIFLDEVGEMTLRMQGLLLRFLETGELQKVGADRGGRIVNVRLVAATNRNLQDLIAREQFREDLYYRLNVIHFQVPPLRERKEDIPQMIEHFLRRYVSWGGHAVKGFEPDAFRMMVDYAWPGNVRELENVVERLVVTGRHELIRVDDLPLEVKAQRGVGIRPRRERRRTVADDLYRRMIDNKESFWQVVYPLYMEREITKQNMRDLIRKGLEESRGNYKIVCRLFNMEQADYKRFLNFLRKHDCQLPFKEFR